MKTSRLLLSLALFAVCALFGVVHGVVPALAMLTLGSAAMITPADMLAFTSVGNAFCAVTLTPVLLLQRTMAALFVKVPALSYFSSEFTTERLKLNQDVIGKIRLRPSTSTYSESTGYKNGSQKARDLLVDVPFKMDQHIHVTVSLNHLNNLADSMVKIEEHIQDSASVIGSSVMRYILGKATSAAFSNGSTFTTGNSDKDALNAIRKSMNLRGVADDRFGIINSDVAETLTGDARITNRYDNSSQNTDGEARVRLVNLAGFRNIIEDPGLDDGNGENITVSGIATTDLITTSAAHGLVVNDRVKFSALGGSGVGLNTTDYYYVQSVPSTTTLKVSATRGGAAVDVTTAYTGSTMAKTDNITGFFATREAIAIKTGLPTDSIELAQAIGVPVSAKAEIVTDPTSGLSMMAYMWFDTNLMDTFVTLACLYGATAGELCDSAKLVMEPSGHILRSA
jgi:hypothetical protein